MVALYSIKAVLVLQLCKNNNNNNNCSIWFLKKKKNIKFIDVKALV